jgi:uncharacterized RDD family membrane protein YckC
MPGADTFFMSPASNGRRLAAFLVDLLFVVLVLEAPFLWVLMALGITIGGDAEPGATRLTDAQLRETYLWTALCLLFFLGVFVLYAYFDGSTKGGSPGKRLLGLRVADRGTGQPIGFRRGLKRRLFWVLGAIPFYLGLLWAFGNDQHQGWHDKAADDLVVEAERSSAPIAEQNPAT